MAQIGVGVSVWGGEQVLMTSVIYMYCRLGYSVALKYGMNAHILVCINLLYTGMDAPGPTSRME